jgi:hypothetical protein
LTDPRNLPRTWEEADERVRRGDPIDLAFPRKEYFMPNVVDLGEYRERDLTPRQKLVLQRIRDGASCGLCGDLGAIIDPHVPGPNAGQPVPCMACGKLGEQGIVGKPRSLPTEGTQDEA